MIVGADHDRIGHAAQHTGRVRNGLAAAKLGRTGIQHDGRAAKLAHRHVERYAGAGRVLLEHHGEDAASQGCIRVRSALGQGSARSLAGYRVVDHGRKGFAPGIAEIEEMPGHLSAGSAT